LHVTPHTAHPPHCVCVTLPLLRCSRTRCCHERRSFSPLPLRYTLRCLPAIVIPLVIALFNAARYRISPHLPALIVTARVAIVRTLPRVIRSLIFTVAAPFRTVADRSRCRIRVAVYGAVAPRDAAVPLRAHVTFICVYRRFTTCLCLCGAHFAFTFCGVCCTRLPRSFHAAHTLRRSLRALPFVGVAFAPRTAAAHLPIVDAVCRFTVALRLRSFSPPGGCRVLPCSDPLQISLAAISFALRCAVPLRRTFACRCVAIVADRCCARYQFSPPLRLIVAVGTFAACLRDRAAGSCRMPFCRALPAFAARSHRSHHPPPFVTRYGASLQIVYCLAWTYRTLSFCLPLCTHTLRIILLRYRLHAGDVALRVHLALLRIFDRYTLRASLRAFVAYAFYRYALPVVAALPVALPAIVTFIVLGTSFRWSLPLLHGARVAAHVVPASFCLIFTLPLPPVDLPIDHVLFLRTFYVRTLLRVTRDFARWVGWLRSPRFRGGTYIPLLRCPTIDRCVTCGALPYAHRTRGVPAYRLLPLRARVAVFVVTRCLPHLSSAVAWCVAAVGVLICRTFALPGYVTHVATCLVLRCVYTLFSRLVTDRYAITYVLLRLLPPRYRCSFTSV